MANTVVQAQDVYNYLGIDYADVKVRDADGDGILTEEELMALTKSQLLILGRDLGVSGLKSSLTKAEIVAAILAAQEEGHG